MGAGCWAIFFSFLWKKIIILIPFGSYFARFSQQTCLYSRGGVLEESLASRTDFEVLSLEGQVLGLGLEASSPRKLAYPRLEDSTIF